MRKRIVTFLSLAILCFITVGSFAETALPYGQSQLDEILVSYAGKEIVLSDQLQVVHNDVNFRETPGGKVLGRLQGGDLLECMYELQYKGELWYCARSAEYGEGFVIGTYAKPVWNNMNWWPLSETEDVISNNMVLFAYWMASYQLDHGLSVIETVGAERQVSIAPMSVRGNQSMIPEDMKIQFATKLFEYGFICRNAAYDKLADPNVTAREKDVVAAGVLQEHYGTDDIWGIISKGSIVLFVHPNDLHTNPQGPTSGRDQTLEQALMERIIEEH